MLRSHLYQNLPFKFYRKQFWNHWSRRLEENHENLSQSNCATVLTGKKGMVKENVLKVISEKI
jgi:hypothetical protein